MSAVTTYRNLLGEFRTTVDNAEKQGVYVNKGTKESHIKLAKQCDAWNQWFMGITLLSGVVTAGFGILTIYYAGREKTVPCIVNSLATALFGGLTNDFYQYSEGSAFTVCAVRQFYSRLLETKPTDGTLIMRKVLGETLEKLETLDVDPSVLQQLDPKDAADIREHLSKVQKHCGSTYVLPNFLNKKLQP